VPTFHNEQLKQKRVKQETEEGLLGDEHLTMDVELLSISENTPEVSTHFWHMYSSMLWTPFTSECV